MSPDMLARLRAVMRGDFRAVTSDAGVTLRPPLRQKPAELRQLRQLRLKNDERRKGSLTCPAVADRTPPGGLVEPRFRCLFIPRFAT
jgi:hypothetical protein